MPRDQRRVWAYSLGAVCPQRGTTLALVLDGAGLHIANDLEIPGNISVLRLPPYAAEINPIENVRDYLRGNKRANKVFETCDDNVSACCDAWNFFANDIDRVDSITTRAWAEVNL